MIPTGIPLGRKPTEHRARDLLWLEGKNLRSGITWAVNIPLEWLLGSVLVFCFFGKNTLFPHGFRVGVDGFGISPGFSVCGRQISSLWALKSHMPAASWHSPGGLSLPRRVFPSIPSKFPQFWSIPEAGESLEVESGQLCALIRVFNTGAGGVNAGSLL